MYPKTANIDNSRNFDSREQGLFSPDNIGKCEFYNQQRFHQSLNYRTPHEVYFQ